MGQGRITKNCLVSVSYCEPDVDFSDKATGYRANLLIGRQVYMRLPW